MATVHFKNMVERWVGSPPSRCTVRTGQVYGATSKQKFKYILRDSTSGDRPNQVDQKSAAVDISRNEFINQCVLYALQIMEDNN